MVATINENGTKNTTISLQEELKKSAISEAIGKLNFKELSPESCWEYLLNYLPDSARKNNGVLRTKYLKRYGHLDYGGWWCGALDILGDDHNWGCLKPRNPYTYDDNGRTKPIKYETPPETHLRPYYLRVDRHHWEKIAANNVLKEKDFPQLERIPDEAIALEFWAWVKLSKSVPIIITEGAKKTASLLSAGFCAVGLSGFTGAYRNPRGADGKPLGDPVLVPEIEAIATKGREIVLCFDNDRKPSTLRNVEIATSRTAKLLRSRGCKVKIMFWGEDYPGIKGVDDLHHEQGEAEVWNVFDERMTERDYKRAIADIQHDLAEDEYKEKFEEAQANDPEGNGKPKVEAITSTEIAPRISYIDAVDPDKSAEPEDEAEPEPELTFQEIALQEIYSDGHYISMHEELYKFNGRFYEKLHPAQEKRKIIGWASKKAVYDPRSRKRVYKYMNSTSVSKIWSWVIDRTAINPEKINPQGVNLANGVLKIRWNGRTPTWKLCPHTPKEYFTYCSEVSFDPSADPTHCNRLLECLDPAPRTALLRQLAAAFDLQTVRRLHSRGIKAAIAKGTGANGKDSIRAAISKIFCAQMTGLGLSEFQAYDNGRKFGLAGLEHSLINWSSENNMGTTLDRVEALNICVTGEEGGIQIERKGKDSYAITPKAIHIFNTNQVPKLKSGMDSLLSRFVVYDFNKTFKQNPNPIRGELQADPRFHDDPQFLIQEVCPALLNRLLEELTNLAREGIDYDSLKAGLDDLQEESTHLWSFVKDSGLELNPDGKIGVSELWEELKKWYEETGTLVLDEIDSGRFKYTWHEQANPHDRNITGANQIYKRFKQLFPKINRVRETADPTNKGRFYISGLKFANSSSLLHYPVTESDSASPTASLPASLPYSSSLSSGEAKSEDISEAETLAVRDGEAVKQNLTQSGNGATQQENGQNKNPADLPPVPEDLARLGYIFRVGQILEERESGRFVMVVEYPGIGSARTTKDYWCEYLDDSDLAWISQSKLKEVE